MIDRVGDRTKSRGSPLLMGLRKQWSSARVVIDRLEGKFEIEPQRQRQKS